MFDLEEIRSLSEIIAKMINMHHYVFPIIIAKWSCQLTLNTH